MRPRCWTVVIRVQMTAIGASRPLRRIPAIVSFLNPQPALSLVGGNRSSCPNTDIRKEFVSRENTGNFIDSELSGASTRAKKAINSMPYEPIPYASEQGIF